LGSGKKTDSERPVLMRGGGVEHRETLSFGNGNGQNGNGQNGNGNANSKRRERRDAESVFRSTTIEGFLADEAGGSPGGSASVSPTSSYGSPVHVKRSVTLDGVGMSNGMSNGVTDGISARGERIVSESALARVGGNGEINLILSESELVEFKKWRQLQNHRNHVGLDCEYVCRFCKSNLKSLYYSEVITDLIPKY
jgi:hypothetical protein